MYASKQGIHLTHSTPKVVGPLFVSRAIHQKARRGRREGGRSSSGDTENKGRSSGTHESQIEVRYLLLYVIKARDTDYSRISSNT